MSDYLLPPLPSDEPARLQRLLSYEVLDSPPEAAYDDFTVLASRLLRVPIALISLIDADRQWFKSKVGLEVDSTSRQVAFCAHAILQDDIFVVEDSHADQRFAQNPLVVGEPYVRFYAGCPLISPDGLAMGTLCVIDREPRKLNEEDADTLRRLSRQLVHLMELRRTEAQQRESQRLLQRQKDELQRLALVAERTHNVVILADKDGLITWVNAAFERVTGYSLNEAVGRKPGELLQFPETSPKARQQLGLAVKERKQARVHILNRGKYGNVYWMDVDLQPLYEQDGEFVGFVAIETDITDLVTRQEHLDALVEAIPIGLVLHDGHHNVHRINSAAKQILSGACPELPTDVTPQLQDLLSQMGQRFSGGQKELISIKNARSEPRWLGVRSAALPSAPGVPGDCILAFSDQTEQIQAGNYVDLAAQTADVGYWTWTLRDDALELSKGWMSRLGLPEGPISTRSLGHPDDQPKCRHALAPVLRGEQPTFKFEERLRTGDGHWRWVLCGGAVTERDAQGRVTRLAGIHLDIDDQKRVEQALHRAATTDPLTGLPNRLVMLDRKNRALSTARRHQQYGALLYLDLDHFKRINDSYGHSAGDELLRQVADRLLAQLRDEDTLSRMGGDEMMVLLPRLGADLVTAKLHANAVAQKLIKVLELPVNLGERSVVLGASVGVTLFPKLDQETVEDLVREADTAMYGAKGDSRGSVWFYESTMQQAATHRLQMDHDLRQALSHDGFELYLQGKWSPQGRLVGAELLLRWKHPQRGWISPAEFIPVAEESELIQHIGRWVLEQAAQVARAIRAERPDFVVSVNISPKQFKRDEFMQDLRLFVSEAGIPPGALMLEITEGILLQEQLARHVVALSKEGYRFSLDDFGTGYSSLSYLKRFDIDKLKIDQSFVRDLAEQGSDQAIVTAIIRMAQSLGLRTIAEGVETAEQAQLLQAYGCDEMQGYWYSRPLEPQAFAAFAQRHRSSLALPQ